MLNDIKMRISNANEVALNRSILLLLGSPTHLIFFANPDNKAILIGGENKPTHLTVAVPKRCYARNDSFRVYNKSLAKALLIAIGNKNCNNLKITGEFIPEMKMVSFATMGGNELYA